MTLNQILKAIEGLSIPERETVRKHITQCNQADRVNHVNYYVMTFGLAVKGGEKTSDKTCRISHEKGVLPSDLTNVFYWDKEAGKMVNGQEDQLKEAKYILDAPFITRKYLKSLGFEYSKITGQWSR